MPNSKNDAKKRETTDLQFYGQVPLKCHILTFLAFYNASWRPIRRIGEIDLKVARFFVSHGAKHWRKVAKFSLFIRSRTVASDSKIAQK